MNLRCVGRNINLSDSRSVVVPIGIDFVRLLVIVHICGGSQIRFEKLENPQQCVPGRLIYRDWMINCVVVNLVKQFRDIPNAFVMRVNALRVKVVECVGPNCAIHVCDDGVTEFSAIIKSGNVHLCGRTSMLIEPPPTRPPNYRTDSRALRSSIWSFIHLSVAECLIQHVSAAICGEYSDSFLSPSH